MNRFAEKQDRPKKKEKNFQTKLLLYLKNITVTKIKTFLHQESDYKYTQKKRKEEKKIEIQEILKGQGAYTQQVWESNELGPSVLPLLGVLHRTEHCFFLLVKVGQQEQQQSL